MGRTGKWFAIEHHGIVPEIVTTAKALGGGLPLGAIIFRKELDYTYHGAHSNTFGGNLVSVASALATLDVVERENLIKAARDRGVHLMTRLRELSEDQLGIGDVRGLGLMVATEFVEADTAGTPAVAFRDRVIDESVPAGSPRAALREVGDPIHPTARDHRRGDRPGDRDPPGRDAGRPAG